MIDISCPHFRFLPIGATCGRPARRSNRFPRGEAVAAQAVTDEECGRSCENYRMVSGFCLILNISPFLTRPSGAPSPDCALDCHTSVRTGSQ